MNQDETRKTAKEILETPFWKDSTLRKSAVLILPGGWQDYRIPEGIKHWPEKGKYLWVAGTRGDPFYTRKEILEIIDKIKGMSIDSYDIENGGWANNTLDQMLWATELLKKNNEINHLILTTAAYHTPRCVLTCLQTMIKQNISKIVISPIPIYHPEGPSFESTEFKGELERIQKYREKGDVASFKVWEEYVLWRDEFINNLNII